MQGDWIMYQLGNHVYSCQVIEYETDRLLLVQRKFEGKWEPFFVDSSKATLLYRLNMTDNDLIQDENKNAT